MHKRHLQKRGLLLDYLQFLKNANFLSFKRKSHNYFLVLLFFDGAKCSLKELELCSLLRGNQGLIFDYDFLSGLQTPTNVRAQSVNDAKLLIISWDYQADVNYSTIHVKSSLKSSIGSGTSTTVVGPTQAPCNSSTCSFCVYDVERNASCYAFNKDYEVSVGIELNFDFFVSYRVGACSRNESSSCINSPWKNFTIPPGGKLKSVYESSHVSQSSTDFAFGNQEQWQAIFDQATPGLSYFIYLACQSLDTTMQAIQGLIALTLHFTKKQLKE